MKKLFGFLSKRFQDPKNNEEEIKTLLRFPGTIIELFKYKKIEEKELYKYSIQIAPGSGAHQKNRRDLFLHRLLLSSRFNRY